MPKELEVNEENGIKKKYWQFLQSLIALNHFNIIDAGGGCLFIS